MSNQNYIIMETIYIARKAQNNAKAFITMNPATKNISVHGKFYDGRQAFPGPMLENVATVPETLVEEIKRRDDKPLSASSPELQDFIASVWAKAEEMEPWFKFESCNDKPAAPVVPAGKNKPSDKSVCNKPSPVCGQTGQSASESVGNSSKNTEKPYLTCAGKAATSKDIRSQMAEHCSFYDITDGRFKHISW